MEFERAEEAMRRADELLDKETPFRRQEKDVFSRIVKAAFGKIKAARDKGFSFEQICRVYVESGLLVKDADPHSFRQAFYRERKRRRKGDELLKMIRISNETERKTARSEPSKTMTYKAANAPEQESANPDMAAEKERIRRMTGVAVNTANGTIIKYTDGSFEF